MLYLKCRFKRLSIICSVGVILFLGCDKPVPPEKKPSLPEVEVDSIEIRLEFSVHEDLKETTYTLPESDKQRIMSLIEEIAPKEIGTSDMESYYSTFGYSVLGVPSSKTLLTSPPKNKSKYWRLYYKNGRIRVKTEIQNDSEKIVAKVFYNNQGAPLLVAEPFGDWYSCYFYEYDENFYLKRRCRVTFIRRLDTIDIFEVKPGYEDVIKYVLLFKEGVEYKIHERYRYNVKGSFSWSAKTEKEKRYSSRSFLDNIKIVEKYRLDTLFPIPE